MGGGEVCSPSVQHIHRRNAASEKGWWGQQAAHCLDAQACAPGAPPLLQHWRWKLQRRLHRGQSHRNGPQQRAVSLPQQQQQQLGGTAADEEGLSEVQQQLLQAQWAQQQQEQHGAQLQPPVQVELEQGRPSGSGATAGV